MKTKYEAWLDESGNSITFAPAENIKRVQAQGLLSKKAKMLHRVEADTYEEAHAVRNIKMGWEPYVPMGKPCKCPKGCGAMFYPEGSGECPNCGRIC